MRYFIQWGMNKALSQTHFLERNIMTTEQIKNVQRTFKIMYGRSEHSAELFFSRLFELDGSLRNYFNGELQLYKRKFIQIVGAGVYGLNRPESIVPVLQEFGRRQAQWGMRNEQYNTIGAAFYWTLSHSLEDEFTPEVMAAWAEAYNMMANVMKNAAAPQALYYQNAQAI